MTRDRCLTAGGTSEPAAGGRSRGGLRGALWRRRRSVSHLAPRRSVARRCRPARLRRVLHPRLLSRAAGILSFLFFSSLWCLLAVADLLMTAKRGSARVLVGGRRSDAGESCLWGVALRGAERAGRQQGDAPPRGRR